MNILKEQPTKEKPYYVENYPYGFRLRTIIRYYVETTKNGQRFVSQTLNPKTNIWNKPKKSTYSQILLIGMDEKQHINYVCLSMYSKEEALKFKAKYEKYLNEYQLKELKNIIAMLEVYDKIEYKITVQKYRHKTTGEITESLPIFDMDNYYPIDENDKALFDCVKEEKEKEQQDINTKINILAIKKASEQTTVNDALSTFKRVR